MTPKTCSMDRCGNRVQARGWCPKHYARWYEHGDPAYVSLRSVGDASGRVKVPLAIVAPDKRAMAWAGQVRFDAASREMVK